ncbi:MAG: 4'-phosphopantetheinyl transferase superfamily protein [Burkholderiales bacterium]|nr:4'-phosphopantetheinyl transferase superfamily protein [Burkholderiales bacterium]
MAKVDLWINSNYDKEKEGEKFWRVVLNNYVQLSEISLEYNEYGKPKLQSMKELHFNVSHTSGVAVVGLSHDSELGIDVESTTRTVVNIRGIIDKFFHNDEKLALEKSQNYEQDFIYLWVIKEAFCKMKASGIGYGLNNFIVDTSAESIFDINEQKYHGYNLINLSNNFVCCVVPKFNKIKFFNF